MHIKGMFVIENKASGRYEGFKYEERRNGIGRLYYLDGGYYEG